MELAKSVLVIAVVLLIGMWLGRKFPAVLNAIPIIGSSGG
jgi:hypothetical protein